MSTEHSFPEKDRLRARNKLRAAGITIREWASTHGVSEKVVFNVLCGRSRGGYGQSHKVAVLLGLKKEEELN